MLGVAQLDLPVGDETAGVIVFVLIAVSTVAAPVIVYRLTGERAQRVLDEMKVWLGQNNAVVMAVLLLIIGALLLGKGISGLST